MIDLDKPDSWIYRLPFSISKILAEGNAQRVALGEEPLVGLLSQRTNYGRLRPSTIRCLYNKGSTFIAIEASMEGWWLSEPISHKILTGGCEIGKAGREASDNAALSAGYVLDNKDHFLVPIGNGFVKRFEKENEE